MAGKNSKLESTFEREFCSELKKLIPNLMILKLNTRQGIPDRLLLHEDQYALLEFKRSEKATHQPNQDWYVDNITKLGGFARFIFPENAEGIKHELLEWFGVSHE